MRKMASAINTLQQSTEPTARRWLWVLFPVNHLFVFCLENPGGWAAIKLSADILHYGDETQRIVEAIADTILVFRGSSEWSVQRSRWLYCSLSPVPFPNKMDAGETLPHPSFNLVIKPAVQQIQVLYQQHFLRI